MVDNTKFKAINVNNGWKLIDDDGMLYFVNRGKFYNINLQSPTNGTAYKESYRNVLKPVWINDPKDVKPTDRRKWNSQAGKLMYYKEESVKEKILERILPKPILEWNMKKPDASLLITIAKLAGQVYADLKSEMEAFICYNNKTNSYEIMIPNQEVSGTTCHFTYDDIKIGIQEVVVDVHSHHSMTCSYSGTDDTDDTDSSFVPHISIVIKNITAFDFSNLDNNIDIRLTYNRKFYSLQLKDVFEFQKIDLPQIKQHTYPLMPTDNFDLYFGNTYKNNFNKSNRSNKKVDINSDCIKFGNGITFHITDLTHDEKREIIDDLEEDEAIRLATVFNNNMDTFIMDYFKRNPNLVYEYCDKILSQLI